MLCVVADKVLVAKVAVPEGSRGAIPNAFVPALKVTVPPGAPDSTDPPLTRAVNVTNCPETEGLRLDVNVVVVDPGDTGGGLTVWFRVGDVLALKRASPP